MKIKESCKRIYTNTTQRKSRNARKFCLIDNDDLEDDTFDESECSEEEYIEVERRNNCSLNDIKIIQKTKEKVKTKRKPKIISKEKPVKHVFVPPLAPGPVEGEQRGEENVEETEGDWIKWKLNTFDIPSQWRVRYSQTTPTVCEVWSGETSVLFILTSDGGALLQLDPPQQIHREETSLFKICKGLEVLKLSGEDVRKDPEQGVEVYQPELAARHLVGGAQSSTVQPRLMSVCEPALMLLCDLCLAPCYPLSPPCGHAYCSRCWRSWLRSRGGRGGVCPALSCSSLLDPTALHWVTGPGAGRGLHSSLLRRWLERLVREEPLLSRCPGCGAVARREDCGLTELSCLCGLSYCPLCSHPSHHPASCHDLTAYRVHYITHTNTTAESELQLTVEVREWPGCGVGWERGGGCHRMECVCGTKFCWSCGRQGVCELCQGDTVKVPLLIKTINYLPAEMVEVRRTQLWLLYTECHHQISETAGVRVMARLGLDTRLDHLLNILLCERAALDQPTADIVTRAGRSLIWLAEKLQKPKPADSLWNNLFRLHTDNVSQAYKLFIGNSQES